MRETPRPSGGKRRKEKEERKRSEEIKRARSYEERGGPDGGPYDLEGANRL